MKYEPNRKHKEPWQRGKKGSLCPTMARELLQELLDRSVLHGKKRFACHGGQAYCAQEHAPGIWHGYPVDWEDVPPQIKNDWIKDAKVTKRQTRRKGVDS